MEHDQYVVLYWNTEAGHDPGWAWTRHDRDGTVLESGQLDIPLGQDDASGAQAALAHHQGCALAWQQGQAPEVVAFVGRTVGGAAPQPRARTGIEVLADAGDTASNAAVTADDIRAIVQHEDTVEYLAIEDLAGKAMRFVRRTVHRRRATRTPPTEPDPPTLPDTDHGKP